MKKVLSILTSKKTTISTIQNFSLWTISSKTVPRESSFQSVRGMTRW